MPSDEPHVQLTGVSKYFQGVRALENVDFACRRGTIHAVLGENGAGKSTLIKIISGVMKPDAGEVRLAGRPVSFANPSEAAAAGIVCIFQELSLIPDLTVADNISLSDPPKRLGLIDRGAQRRRAERLLARIKCEDVNPQSLVRDLSLSRRQMVEIAKAIGRDPSVLILDEATSALTSRDVETVYGLLADLKAQGVASIFISHRMHEVDALCDTLSVFRNGRHIETFPKGARSGREIVHLMIGRDVEAQFPPKPARPRPAPLLEVKGLRWEPGSRASTSRSAAARSSASAVSTARARRSSFWRSSASSAVSRAASASATPRASPPPPQPPRPPAPAQRSSPRTARPKD